MMTTPGGTKNLIAFFLKFISFSGPDPGLPEDPYAAQARLRPPLQPVEGVHHFQGREDHAVERQVRGAGNAKEKGRDIPTSGL